LPTEKARTMQGLSRVPCAFAAVFCGISASIGWIVFLQTYFNTPTVKEVPIYVGTHFLRWESKEWYLLSPELLLTVFFLWTAYYALTWKRFVLKGVKIQESFVRRFPTLGRLNMSILLVAICYLICGFSAFHLWDLINRSKEISSLA
jgi:hypothetical protein